jgi:hypothetical protein
MANKAPAKVLRIGLFQNNRIIEEKLLRQPKQVTIGSALTRNTFVVPASDLPANMVVFDVKQGQYILNLTQKMTGRVKMGDQLATLQELIQSGRAKKSGAGYVLPLDQSAQGRVAIGEATLLFQFVTPPPPRPTPVLPASMRGGWIAAMGIILSASLFASAVVHIFPVVYLVNTDFPEPSDLERTIPDRFVQIMVDEPDEPEPEPDPTEIPEVEGEGEPEPTSEPEVAKKPAKDDGPEEDEAKDDKPKSADELAKAEVERKKKLAADVQNKTILSQIGAKSMDGGGSLVDRLGGGAGKTAMDDAFANSKGVTTASADTEKSGLRTTGGSGGDGTGKTAGGVKIGKSSAAGEAGKGTGTGKKKEKEVKGKFRLVTDNAPAVGGQVDAATVSRKLKLKGSAFQKCYNRELKKNPKASGKVVVVFTIGTAGRVTSSKASSDSVGGGVGACVASEISRIRFGRPKGGAATIKKSFVFDT